MKIFKAGSELITLAEVFKKIPFLESFDDHYLKEIVNASKMVRYEPGETIISEGGIGDDLYILFDGRVKIFKEGKPIAVFDKIGDIFGELAMLDDRIRTATAVASGDTWCLVVGISFLERLQPEDQSACYAVLYSLFSKILAERLMTTTEELARTARELEAVRKELAALGSP